MRSGVVPTVAMIESTSPVTAIELVATGAGLGIAPELAVQRHYSSANLVKRSKVSPAIQRGQWLCWQRWLRFQRRCCRYFGSGVSPEGGVAAHRWCRCGLRQRTAMLLNS